MTTEEIDKAASNYSDKGAEDNYAYISPEYRKLINVKYDAFKAGVDFANKHWQEKTRWKSFEKEPPKFEGQKYQVMVRFVPGIYDVVCIIGLRSIERAIAAGYKDWKEIE